MLLKLLGVSILEGFDDRLAESSRPNGVDASYHISYPYSQVRKEAVRS